MTLIDYLIQENWLKTDSIKEAFQKIKREDFLPEGMKNLAELNEALPIGLGQTISQPLVVAFMLELLQPKSGEKILDIGSGSGWTSALLAHIVSSGELKSNIKYQISKIGKVIAIEIVPELKEFGEKNVAKYNFIKKGIVEFICGDGSKGYPNIAVRPELAEGFDKILASASVHPHTFRALRFAQLNESLCSKGVGAREIPEAWKQQLKINGKIVTPIGNSIWLLEKKSEKEFEEKEYPGFVFVPLIHPIK